MVSSPVVLVNVVVWAIAAVHPENPVWNALVDLLSLGISELTIEISISRHLPKEVEWF